LLVELVDKVLEFVSLFLGQRVVLVGGVGHT
jgi:hypothetical protein